MKKTLFLLCLLMSALSLWGQTYRIGYFSLEPYVLPDDGPVGAAGAAVDYWEEYVAPKAGIDLEWVGPYPLERLMSLLSEGDLDIVLIAAKSPQREAIGLFPDTPFISMQAGIMVRKDSALDSIDSIEDIYGMTIGYLQSAFLPPFMDNSQITMDYASTADYKNTNFQKLLRRRIDGILDLNIVSNPYEARKRGIADQVKTLTLPYPPTPIYSIFAKNAKGRDLLEVYNDIAAGLPSNLIDTLLEEY